MKKYNSSKCNMEKTYRRHCCVHCTVNTCHLVVVSLLFFWITATRLHTELCKMVFRLMQTSVISNNNNNNNNPISHSSNVNVSSWLVWRDKTIPLLLLAASPLSSLLLLSRRSFDFPNELCCAAFSWTSSGGLLN